MIKVNNIRPVGCSRSMTKSVCASFWFAKFDNEHESSKLISNINFFINNNDNNNNNDNRQCTINDTRNVQRTHTTLQQRQNSHTD